MLVWTLSHPGLKDGNQANLTYFKISAVGVLYKLLTFLSVTQTAYKIETPHQSL